MINSHEPVGVSFSTSLSTASSSYIITALSMIDFEGLFNCLSSLKDLAPDEDKLLYPC